MTKIAWWKYALVLLILNAHLAGAATERLLVPIPAVVHPIAVAPISLNLAYLTYPHLDGHGWIELGFLTALTKRTTPEVGILLPTTPGARYGGLLGIKQTLRENHKSSIFIEGTFSMLRQISTDLQSLGLHVGWANRVGDNEIGLALGIEGIDRLWALTAGSRLSTLHSLRTSLSFTY